MCNALQLTPAEKMRTPDAIRKVLGPGSLKWQYGGFVRSEGVKINQEGAISWGSEKWRGTIFKVFPIVATGFWEKSRETKNNLRFDLFQDQPGEPGQLIIAVYQHWEEPTKVPRFGLITAYDPRVAALCKKTRSPLILPMNVTPTEALNRLQLVAA